MAVYTIGFADGTAWGGQLYKRDRGSKRGWKSVEKPKGSASSRAVFSSPFMLASFAKDGLLGWKTGSSADGINRVPRFRMSAPLDDVVPCGSALIATHACPNNQSGCNYDYVGQFDNDPDNPNKSDAQEARSVRCYVTFNGKQISWLRQLANWPREFRARHHRQRPRRIRLHKRSVKARNCTGTSQTMLAMNRRL